MKVAPNKLLESPYEMLNHFTVIIRISCTSRGGAISSVCCSRAVLISGNAKINLKTAAQQHSEGDV